MNNQFKQTLMKTFISVIDTQSGDIQYAKYYISNKEFGTRILERYVARFVLGKPLEECAEFIRSRMHIGRNQLRCYFDYNEQNKNYSANMTTISGENADCIIMSMPNTHSLIVIDDNGKEQDM